MDWADWQGAGPEHCVSLRNILCWGHRPGGPENAGVTQPNAFGRCGGEALFWEAGGYLLLPAPDFSKRGEKVSTPPVVEPDGTKPVPPCGRLTCCQCGASGQSLAMAEDPNVEDVFVQPHRLAIRPGRDHCAISASSRTGIPSFLPTYRMISHGPSLPQFRIHFKLSS